MPTVMLVQAPTIERSIEHSVDSTSNVRSNIPSTHASNVPPAVAAQNPFGAYARIMKADETIFWSDGKTEHTMGGAL